ncbi:hypothetical protein GCM10023160_25230 [Brachybacterium paraconglomeratum]|uniref:hypothetical protein n=1 Tax=Brachybacterium paraconglomeratum TaxID=173362 RepID=UPI0031EA6C6A
MPPGLRLLLVLVAGIGYGLIVCVVNATAFTGQFFLSKLLGGIWAWICVPYVVAWAGSGTWPHFWRPLLFIESAVITYYIYDFLEQALRPTTIAVGPPDFLFGAVYTVAALLMCATFRVVIPVAKGTSRWRIPAFASIPALVAYFAFAQYPEPGLPPTSVFYDPVQQAVSLVVIGVAVLAVIIFASRTNTVRRTSHAG